MKKAVAVLIIMMSMAVTYAQTITVASDRKLDTDFSKYKTFGWASQVDSNLDEGFFFLNDLILKADVREAIEAELLGLGYAKQSNNPDLVVNFRVFEQPTRIQGFESYGTTFWGDMEYREISDTTSYEVEAGTLFVSLVDRKKGEIVWNGFASGLIDNNKFIKDEGKIREAANLIFEEYGQRAREYSRK